MHRVRLVLRLPGAEERGRRADAAEVAAAEDDARDLDAAAAEGTVLHAAMLRGVLAVLRAAAVVVVVRVEPAVLRVLEQRERIACIARRPLRIAGVRQIPSSAATEHVLAPPGRRGRPAPAPAPLRPRRRASPRAAAPVAARPARVRRERSSPRAPSRSAPSRARSPRAAAPPLPPRAPAAPARRGRRLGPGTPHRRRASARACGAIGATEHGRLPRAARCTPTSSRAATARVGTCLQRAWPPSASGRPQLGRRHVRGSALPSSRAAESRVKTAASTRSRPRTERALICQDPT